MVDDYCLKPGYVSRRATNADLATTDHAQRAVYEFARKIADADHRVQSVLDWGCGSGWKLVDLFGHLDTLGADVDYRLPTLLQRFPGRRWEVCPVPVDAGLVMCVDVIEHVDDPTELLRTFSAGRWRHLVISTPEREMVAQRKCKTASHQKQQRNGPPRNRWHAREWTSSEFAALVFRELSIRPKIQLLGRWNLVAHVHRS
jgi:hypothetical protein